MTQAFNLSQLANNVNSSGQLDVTTGVTNTLPIANGGTGQITQQAALNALAGAVTNGYVLQGDGTNVSMTALSASTITTGTLSIAYGGTNGSATPTAGGIAYGNGSAYAFTSVGTSGQVLTSNGAGVPTWTTLTSFTYPSAGIANSTGSAWGTSYSVSGTGDVALTNSPTFTTRIHTPIVYGGTTNSSQLVLASTSVASGATDSIVLKVNGTTSPISALTINNAGLVSLSSALPLTSGGTGGTNAQTGINNLAGATTSGLYLRGNGTNVVMSSIQAADVPTLNQNTTGSAAKWTTARNLAGNSVDGSANVAFSNKFIVQGTTDSGLSGAQFLGALGTGLVKNTTTTGVLSIASSGTDYAPATSGSSILYGNGSGGFSNVTIGTGVSFAGGTLSATGSGGTVTSVSVTSANGFAGTVATSTSTPAITLSTTITGLLKGNGTAISAATSGTDYAPATSGSSILYGNGSGGFSNATVGTGLSFSTGTLSNAGVTSFTSSSGLSTNTSATGAVSVTNTAPMTYPSGTGIAVVTSGTSWGTTLTAPSGTIVGTTDTQTLTNKRVTPRVTSITANTATPTINTDNCDLVVITGQSVAITSFTTNLSGTPTNGQKLQIAITGTTSIALTWGASFEASTVSLPTTTSSTNRLDVGFIWNSATSKWRCLASA